MHVQLFSLRVTQEPASQTWLEGVQNRALSCIFPGVSYNDALSLAGIGCMRVHHTKITSQPYHQLLTTLSNKIHGLLPESAGAYL